MWLGIWNQCWYYYIFTLQRGQGAPGREPVVSEDEQKKMMAYYYKKQEEMKVCIVSNKLI